MKKTKFVLLSLVVAMILMGAGYAAWTQTFTINSTVSTGELFVLVTNNGITGLKVDTNGNASYDDNVDASATNQDQAEDLNLDYPTVAVTNGDVSANAGTTLSEISYTMSKLYPGTQVTSEIKFDNKGTIKTRTSATDNSGSIVNDAIWDDLIIKVNGTAVEGSGQTKLDNLATAIADAVGELEPAGTKTVTLVQELPISSENDTENKNALDWQVQLTFEQFNAVAQ
ncbi:MAG: hypothetical protein RO469_11260 [Thermincola sp.]|jgi:cytoskeletal protein RodZ|nr:hypothetical protein [Thermincola sp.]MDT3701580.1 hypothetical protein [Thermincola sp.]